MQRPDPPSPVPSSPFPPLGSLWLMWLLGFNMPVAVAVGVIALAGAAAETGVVMLIYLDQAEREKEGAPFTIADLNRAIMRGAAERVRPHRRQEPFYGAFPVITFSRRPKDWYD